MNRKLRYICILFLPVLLQPADGQEQCCGSQGGSLHFEQPLSGELYNRTLHSATFFNEEWQLADLELANGAIVKNKYIRYNCLLDELFWLETESKKNIRLDKPAIRQFHFKRIDGDTTVHFKAIYINIDNADDSSGVFAEELYLGNVSLYVYHRMVFDHREILSLKKGLYQKTIYTEVPVYYFRFLNSTTVGLKRLNLKSLDTLLPGHREQIRKYLRKNMHGRSWNRAELAQLAGFLSTVSKQ